MRSPQGALPTPTRGVSHAPFDMFAPAVAAIIMRLFISKEGLKGSLGPVRRWRYYLVALFLPIALVAGTIGVASCRRSQRIQPRHRPTALVCTSLALAGRDNSVLARGEEYGWRGYLLPRLLPLGEVKASIILALIWAPWHLPSCWAGSTTSARTRSRYWSS
jgi:uncharacterized protein